MMGMHGGGPWPGFLRAPAEKPRLTWGLLKRVLGYSTPYRWQIAAVAMIIFITAFLNLLPPLIFRELIDHTLPDRNLQCLVLLAGGIFLVPLANGGLDVIQRRLRAQAGEGVIYDLRVALFAHLQRLSLRFFTHTRVGELMSRLNNDVVGAQNAISNTLVNIFYDLVQAIVLLVVMFSLEWRLTLLSLILLPLFVVVARRVGVRLRDTAREQMDLNAQMNAMANETLNIGGALLVKLFGRSAVEVERFSGRAALVRDKGVERAVLGTLFFISISLLSAAGSALIYGVGGYFVIQRVFTIGTIVAFSTYLGSLYRALNSLANAPVEFATSVVSFERVFEVLDLPPDIPESPDAIVLQEVRGELVFEDVTFKYDVDEKSLLSDVHRYGQMEAVTAVLSGGKGAGTGRSREGNGGGEEAIRTQAREMALEHIDFRVAPGQLVALVGPSGAGKTTLTYLIPRLYDPTAGRILLDGHDLRTMTLASLAAQIGMVTQEAYLFHDTIRTNLLYARLDATQDELEVATRAANIHDFIVSLPAGYDTIVGERGYRLSGGEKQRIALARVILKDPRILVLDEATSHLDSESEALIQEALKRVMAGRTSIVIAHRLSTILAADLILVFDRGRIVERGTHQDLLALGGLYAQLYETQFSRGRGFSF